MASGEDFEIEVRRVAQARWPGGEKSGVAIVDGRERDGVYITRDQVVVIEATTLRTLEKARQDGKKLDDLTKKYGRSHKMHAVKGFFVTKNEPTAHQIEEIRALKNNAVVAVSFDEFRAQLIDARGYMDLRGTKAFGSARSPEDDTDYEHPGKYVGMELLESSPRADRTWDVSKIAGDLVEGKRFLLLGDFGAGKSMTLREIYFRLETAFKSGETLRFPIYLNLDDHIGQTDPSEALERHARRLGFDEPNTLVKAWRSGYVTLLLDGFDEMAAVNWSGDLSRVHEARRRAVQLVSEFNNQSPRNMSIICAGRQHYFDSEEERQTALSYTNDTVVLSLNDFTDAQVKQFLKKSSVPPWLPRRPFLLGYLAGRNMLPDDGGEQDPAKGWDELINGIVEREARATVATDGKTIRRVLERLASYARTTLDGLGPLSFDEIGSAFREIVGRAPEESDLVMLQRLPGLGVVSHTSTVGRRFIDGDLAQTLAAGDPFEFSINPYGGCDGLNAHEWHLTLGDLGSNVLAARSEDAQIPSTGQLQAARVAAENDWCALAFDLRAAIARRDEQPASQSTLSLNSSIEILDLDLTAVGSCIADVRFQGAVIHHLTLELPVDASSCPTFTNCLFETVEGCASEDDLPADRFSGCSFEKFDSAASTTSALLSLNLPPATRVGLTILKKLFVQRGSGRLDSALRRGLDEKDRKYVNDALKVFESNGLIFPSRTGNRKSWLPANSERGRITAILQSPMTSSDGLISQLNDL